MLLEGKPSGYESNTMAFFEEWSKNSQNTVGKILDALEKIKRPHEVRMLNEAKNEILESYLNTAEVNSVFQLSDKIPYSSGMSVDLPSETASFNDPYYMNSYERVAYPSNVISEERNSRQLTCSIPETCSFADSRLGCLTEPDRNPSLTSALNDLVEVDKNYNQKHSFMPEKIINCGVNKEKKPESFTCADFWKNISSAMGSKKKKVTKSKVDEYFNRAHFVLICFDHEYIKSIQRVELEEEEKPDELHAAYIFSKIKVEALFRGSKHRFIPLLFKGGTVDNIPLWLNSRHYKWPDQYNELSLFLNNPQNSIHSFQ
ncbi:TRAF3IP2 [Acanthosepion pharaonis]|uniref:TRAF3IP2 n=1 Tax=Acanthosepion pharaonis TaxID=158019 RepID=A0A812EIM1_ACAPH|nr:TRAF3IP2 [Sepia pharaonis]